MKGDADLKKIRIGGGAGYGGDRIEPAVDLIRFGNLDYIIFECLAERTIALAQQKKKEDLSLIHIYSTERVLFFSFEYEREGLEPEKARAGGQSAGGTLGSERSEPSGG